jgi:hypothetical protein
MTLECLFCHSGDVRRWQGCSALAGLFGAGRAVRRWQVVAIEAALEKPSQNPWILDAAKNLSWLGTAIAASQNLTKPYCFNIFFTLKLMHCPLFNPFTSQLYFHIFRP